MTSVIANFEMPICNYDITTEVIGNIYENPGFLLELESKK